MLLWHLYISLIYFKKSQSGNWAPISKTSYNKPVSLFPVTWHLKFTSILLNLYQSSSSLAKGFWSAPLLKKTLGLPSYLRSSSDDEPGVLDGSVITCFVMCVRNFPIEHERFIGTCSNMAAINNNNNNFELFTFMNEFMLDDSDGAIFGPL